MKKILTTIVFVFVFVYAGYAQHSFYTSYQHATVQAKDQEGSRVNSNGVIIGYQYRVHAKQDIPLYLTVGAEFNWNWSKTNEEGTETYDYPYKEDDGTIETIHLKANGWETYKTNYGGLKVPINFAYEIALSKKTPIYIIPKIGIHAYVNFNAHQTFNGTYDVYDRDTGKKYFTMNETDDYGLINSHDLGVYTYHRIVAGWQVGCSVRYGHYILGGTFEQELMHLTDYGHSSTFTIKLGYEL